MGLEPASFGATIRQYLFLCVALCCRNRLSKPIFLLMVAHGFCVLRAQWCQQWCQIGSSALPYPDGSYRTEDLAGVTPRPATFYPYSSDAL